MSDASPLSLTLSLSSTATFSVNHARSLVEDYAKREQSPDQTSKVLFAFLEHLPLESAIIVADDIISHSGKLRVLADHYVSTVLFPIRAAGGKTPSAISMRPGEDDVDDVSTQISPQKRDQAKLKAICLARDNNRCMMSGLYDSKLSYQILSSEERRNVKTAKTEAAHILPFSLSSFKESERHYKAAIWEGIYHMFPRVRGFSPTDINDPGNVMTLWESLHGEFGNFELCLEPTAIADRYRIKKYKVQSLINDYLPSSDFVTFTAHDGRYPLPREDLLSIHAAVGAVLHASGMAEIIDRVLEEREELRCLANDGSTQVGLLLMVY